MARRLACLIGNQTFRPESGLEPLKGPRNDVEALARVLGDPDSGGFTIETFLDRPSAEIKRALNRTLNGAERGDTILIFYAGHGKLDRLGKLCLATADTEEEALYATSIPAQNLRDMVDHARADCTVLLLDCCYSGAFGGHRGDVSSEIASLAREASGLYVLTASTAVQTAKEGETIAGGITLGRFTAAIVGGIENGTADRDGDGRISLSDLNRHLRDTLREQTPQFWAQEASGDPVIARVRILETPEEKRLRRLGAWFAEGGIPDALFPRMVDAVQGTGEPHLTALVRRLLDQADAKPAALVVAWRGATEPRKSDPRPDLPPPETPMQRRRSLLDRWYAEGALREGEYSVFLSAVRGEGDPAQVALVQRQLDRDGASAKALRAAWTAAAAPVAKPVQAPTAEPAPFAAAAPPAEAAVARSRGRDILIAVGAGFAAAVVLMLFGIISSDPAFLLVAILAGAATYGVRRSR
ncbi:caspase family protein [Roseomonas eburnea]|uniref:Caspase family protein n=1 Tax=Neoroseomonas eburnea TaxID=1346889 RepID=A0A9X9X5U0_9PROT|nr:caspase family protein [Neoroseomonas eburnea]MBR0679076.1 caspase family protein [Neoroseomonas eburnea]